MITDMTRIRDYLAANFLHPDGFQIYMTALAEISAGRNFLDVWSFNSKKLLDQDIVRTRSAVEFVLNDLVAVSVLAVFKIDGKNCYAVHPHGHTITDEMIASRRQQRVIFDRDNKRVHRAMEQYAHLSDVEFFGVGL